jgi:hypothetical protein
MVVDADVRPVPAGEDVVPPIAVFVPAIIEGSPRNTATCIADLMAADLDLGDGSYAVEHGPSAGPDVQPPLLDHRRIVRVGDGPVLDLCTVDYRSALKHKDSVAGDSLLSTLRQLAVAAGYFFIALTLLMRARRRAKKPLAKAQLVVGFGAALLLLALLALSVVAVVVALGLWKPVKDVESFTTALGMGAAALLTWAFVTARPRLTTATDVVRQALDYARQQQVSGDCRAVVRKVLDRLITEHPQRPIHLIGYSFGSLVAIDLLFPKTDEAEVDERFPQSIASLTTIGCPVDFLRLYFPDYLDGRRTDMKGVDWTNIFIPADVFGSNFTDTDDFSDSGSRPAGAVEVIVGDCSPRTVRYTREELSVLNILARKGFSSHAAYWSVGRGGNCLHTVTSALVRQPVR